MPANGQPRLGPSLRDRGNVGATGTTRYQGATAEQVQQIEAVREAARSYPANQTASPSSFVINVNFEGTHNKGNLPRPGEPPTNMHSLAGRAVWLVRWARWGGNLLLLLWLVGCASPGVSPGASVIPGAHPTYSFGISQNRLMFERQIARAQVNYSPYRRRMWGDFTGGEPSGFMGGLTGFHPLDVRWQLKDGRQFFAERVDVGRLVRDFAETRQISLQHQREGRPFGPIGDSEPLLVIAVANRWLVLKWQIVFNLRPVAERLKPPGTAGPAIYAWEEHVIAIIPGTPAQGIDFDQKWDTVPEQGVTHAR